MAWSPYHCNDHRYWSFKRNTCNRCIDIFKIFFKASSQTNSATVTTIWRPGFSSDHLSMHKRWICLDKMLGQSETTKKLVFRFTSNCLQTDSLFWNGETFNQKVSMIFWQFISLASCVWVFMLVHIKKYRTFGQIWIFLLKQQTQVVLILLLF